MISCFGRVQRIKPKLRGTTCQVYKITELILYGIVLQSLDLCKINSEHES